MNRNQALIHYHLAKAVFQRWFDQGMINREELIQINRTIADKYGLSLESIYR